VIILDLIFGMNCPESLRNECLSERIVSSAVNCNLCRKCRTKAYQLCPHCNILIRNKHKDEFDKMNTALVVMENL
jgi:hypothetical protein